MVFWVIQRDLAKSYNDLRVNPEEDKGWLGSALKISHDILAVGLQHFSSPQSQRF